MDSASSSSSSNGRGEENKKELSSWVGDDVRFLTLNEKKKLYLGGPGGMFVDTENQVYLAWLRQQQVHRAKCACCGKKEEGMKNQDDKEEEEEVHKNNSTFNDKSNIKLLRCSRCEITAYNSSHCQKEHWKNHKKVCKKPNNECFKIEYKVGGGDGDM
jgi:MYND finger